MPSQSSSQVTTDHERIRRWTEERGGKPATVKGTEDRTGAGLLRIDFEGYGGEDTLEEVSWEDFFEKFEEKELAFLFQETTKSGKKSRFFKFIQREEDEDDGQTEEDRERNRASETRESAAVSDELIESLCSLMELDIEAVAAYRQVMDLVDNPRLQNGLSKGCEDHERHVLDLENMILGFGGQPLDVTNEMEQFENPKESRIPTDGSLTEILEAMEAFEVDTNSTYETALSWDLPEAAAEIVKKNREDEKRHLSWVRKAEQEIDEPEGE